MRGTEWVEAPPYVSEGLLAGTPLATPQGWVAVERIAPGDRVLTFEGGERAVVAVQSAVIDAGRDGWPMEHWPLLVPEGALGNREELRLLPDQPVLLESDTAEAMFGDALTLVPAAALEGWRGIAAAAPDGQESVHLLILEEEALLYAAGPVLLFCPADLPNGVPGIGRPEETARPYTPLALAEARALIAMLIAAEAGQGDPVPPALEDRPEPSR